MLNVKAEILNLVFSK